MAVDVVSNVKASVVKDFSSFVARLNIGYKDDYSMILNKIMFIQTIQYLDKIEFIYEYLMNN